MADNDAHYNLDTEEDARRFDFEIQKFALGRSIRAVRVANEAVDLYLGEDHMLSVRIGEDGKNLVIELRSPAIHEALKPKGIDSAPTGQVQ